MEQITKGTRVKKVMLIASVSVVAFGFLRLGMLEEIGSSWEQTTPVHYRSNLRKPKVSDRIATLCPILKDRRGEHAAALSEASEEHRLARELLAAVMIVESGCRHNARSPRGAVGLMQLLPATAKEMGVRNIYSPRGNIFGGARYLEYLLKQFKGNIRLALAAYNAGPNAVIRHRGVPPYRETRAYVDKVIWVYQELIRDGTLREV